MSAQRPEDRSSAGEGTLIALRLTLNGRALDRRAFLGALGLTAAGTVLAGRARAAAGEDSRGGLNLSQEAVGGADGTWHVDDMWGHWPRYAHPIPYSSMHQPFGADNVAPADRLFVL